MAVHTKLGLNRRDLRLDGRVDVAGLVGDVDLKHECADRLAGRYPNQRFRIFRPPVADDAEVRRGLLPPTCPVNRLAGLGILLARCEPLLCFRITGEDGPPVIRIAGGNVDGSPRSPFLGGR